jgi:NAD(P)H dehydrogenase (quinone)
MTDKRNVLIVVAHPDTASFNHAMAGAAADALRAAGHEVTISDLAGEGFRADLGPDDMTPIEGADRFHIQAEQANAARTHGFAPDIAREQARVAAADNIILQFPMWWGGPPALLKGWADRVLAYGFAYVDGRRFDTGLFQGRRAMLSVTTGGTPERFSPQGVYGPIGPLLMPMQRLTLEYMGFAVEQPYVAHGVPRTDDADRRAHMDRFAQAALNMAAKPVAPTDAWRTALDEVPAGAWARKA